jgi:hypothetical protein
MKQRSAIRIARRLKTLYGVAGPTQLGFTHDLSETGLFITAAQLPRLGAKVSVRIEGPNPLETSGEVVRHSIVPPELRTVMRHGFGVKVAAPREVMREFIASTSPSVRSSASAVQRPLVYWASRSEYERARSEELVRGGLSFISARSIPLNEELEISLACAWKSGDVVVKVRTVFTQPVNGTMRVMVTLLDPADSLSRIDAHMLS